ncbi:MAG TPA: 4-demethylwyosine synthase TYW1 [Nitrososphaeraceae archaeon]|nr:4-demethylwyosine synthase TYW1 [Nitrososphaeraceae archaeon]
MSCSDEYVYHDKESNLINITPTLQVKLRKAKYGVFNHSAVELCHWTKKSFYDQGTCYKHKFYGISTHRCMEMTPTAMNCENRCVYCWRPTEFYDTLQMPADLVDEPDAIIHQLLKEREKLIVGFYGNSKSNKQKLDESLFPAHYAISLSGEPTMYPKLPDLIKYLKSLKNTKSIFLVTNGQEPDMINRLINEDALPTQIYLSTNASNKRMFYQINRPKYRDAWVRWLTTLRILSKIDTRTVLRITLIRNYNNDLNIIPEFADLINQGNPHFIEIKSYMHIGMSTNRLEQNNMLEIAEVREFTNTLQKFLPSYSVMDESEISRIVVIQNNQRYVDRWIKEYFEDKKENNINI